MVQRCVFRELLGHSSPTQTTDNSSCSRTLARDATKSVLGPLWYWDGPVVVLKSVVLHFCPAHSRQPEDSMAKVQIATTHYPQQ